MFLCCVWGMYGTFSFSLRVSCKVYALLLLLCSACCGVVNTVVVVHRCGVAVFFASCIICSRLALTRRSRVVLGRDAAVSKEARGWTGGGKILSGKARSVLS